MNIKSKINLVYLCSGVKAIRYSPNKSTLNVCLSSFSNYLDKERLKCE